MKTRTGRHIDNRYTPAQHKEIWRLLIKAGISRDSDLRRDIQGTITGKSSMKDFTKLDAHKVIVHLKTLAGEPQVEFQRKPRAPRGAPPYHDPLEPPSEDQLQYIFGALDTMGADARAKLGWMSRQLGTPRWPATRREAQGLIEALKGMTARGYKFGAAEKEKEKKI